MKMPHLLAELLWDIDAEKTMAGLRNLGMKYILFRHNTYLMNYITTEKFINISVKISSRIGMNSMI